MANHTGGYWIGLVLVVGVIAVAGVGIAQTEDPAWADELYTEMTEQVTAYNADITDTEIGLIERSLFRNARINLHVTAGDGTKVTYGLRTDRQLNIEEISRQPWERPTLQIHARKPAIDHILAADEPVTATSQAIKTGRIRIKSVLVLPFGLLIAVGATELLVGAGVGVLVVGGLKVGSGTVTTSATGSVTRMAALLRDLWRLLTAVWRRLIANLGEMAAALTIGEHLGILEWCKEQLTHLRDRLTTLIEPILPQGGNTESNGMDRDDP
ncbi:MAG: hypothetical protein SVG88_08885 [Halobacteriales archaeon]|nr:hypothetical protein [Halobacteriales archaeon]